MKSYNLKNRQKIDFIICVADYDVIFVPNQHDCSLSELARMVSMKGIYKNHQHKKSCVYVTFNP